MSNKKTKKSHAADGYIPPTDTVPVVVSTEFRGVFFGYLSVDHDRRDPSVLTLHGARMLLYWSKETQGFTGLAADGPAEGSRIAKRAPVSIVIYKITAIMDCAGRAEVAWNQ